MVEYDQISQDWRHRDNLTWQIPSIIVIIGGALIVAAYGLDISPEYIGIIRPILLGFGTFLSACLTVSLAQNLIYQVGSGEALKKIIKGEGNKIPKNKLRRTLSPKDFNISKREVVSILFHELTGSTLLLLLCIGLTLTLFILLSWSIAPLVL